MLSPEDSQFLLLQTSKLGELTTYATTGDQVIHGSRPEFQRVIQYITSDIENFNTGSSDRSVFDVDDSLFVVHPALERIATYSEAAVARLYPTLKSMQLPSLINAHLHEHFLRTHSVLAVLDPVETSRLTLFHQRAANLAKSIAACPVSPLPGTCPPGLDRCKPCKPGTVVLSRSLERIPRNAFLLATVPHPYTFLSYVQQNTNLGARFVRGTRRDEWLQSVTSDAVDKRIGGYQRMEYLKSYIQSAGALSDAIKIHGFWQIWEEESEGLSLMLGFQVLAPRKSQNVEKAAQEDPIAFAAKERVLTQGPESGRDMVESWNLAYTELWYFLKTIQRRRKSEWLEVSGSAAF
jgi:hypothetical protein